jgi:hypothetical protein
MTMNESIRTLVFVGVGALAALTAYATRPVLDHTPIEGPAIVGEQLFKDFKDPLAAKSLEIKEFDEATARAQSFMVSQQPSGLWVIPSHGNYPADAESQLKAVAETLSDLKCLGIASQVSSDHTLFGVNDPEKAEVGTQGVGTLVAMQDAKGNDLLRLIVGKEVAGATNQRFVRRGSEDLVLVTSIDMTKLPTEFDKWIEKDLLKLSTFDVAKITLKSSALQPTRRGLETAPRQTEAELEYDSTKSGTKDEWKIVSLKSQGREAPLGELEELNTSKLNELRSGLGDVKIVDVVRKPGSLGSSLKVSSEKLTDEQRRALELYGFYPLRGEGAALEIEGANGELRVDTKDGVQYILRFGNLAAQVDIDSTTSKKKKDGGASAEDQVKVQRYLFVTTQLAPSILKQPELEPLPAGPEPSADAKAADEAKKDDVAKVDKADEKAAEGKAAIVDPQQAERERIKKENERKMNAYNDQKRKAESRVADLNARFADWYYVVSEDVYKKIRLNRSDFVKESATAKEEGFGIDAFRKLEEEGPKGTAKPASPATPASPFPQGFPPM